MLCCFKIRTLTHTYSYIILFTFSFIMAMINKLKIMFKRGAFGLKHIYVTEIVRFVIKKYTRQAVKEIHLFRSRAQTGFQIKKLAIP